MAKDYAKDSFSDFGNRVFWGCFTVFLISVPPILFTVWRTAVFVFTIAKSLVVEGNSDLAFFPVKQVEYIDVSFAQYGSLRSYLHFLVDWWNGAKNLVIDWLNSGIGWFNELHGFWQGSITIGLWYYPILAAFLIFAYFFGDTEDGYYP